MRRRELINPLERSTSNPDGLNLYITRKNVPNAYEVLPGLRTTSAMYHQWCAGLHDALTSEFPASKKDGAVLESPGIGESWGRLYNLMGVPHNPEGVPPFSTAGYHEALARATGKKADAISSILEPETVVRARRIAKLLVPDDPFLAPLRPVHIKRAVVTGIPAMTSDMEEKYAEVKEWHDEWPRICDLIESGDLRTLARDHLIYFLYFVGRRYQADMVKIVDGVPSGKARPVLDFHGKWVVADKTAPDWMERGRFSDRFLRCRSRKINASPLAATYPLRAVAAVIEHHIDTNYVFTHYHTGPASLASKMEGQRDLFMVDVDNHDVNMPPQLRDIFCDAVTRSFGSTLGEIFRMTMRMPQLVRNDYEGQSGVKMEGDPYDKSTFVADYVNPSGHPGTSLLAKYAGDVFGYDALVRMGLVEDTDEGARAWLQGRAKVKTLNAGDNMTFAGVPGGMEALQASSPYCRYSDSYSFQGNVAIRTPNGGVMWKANPITLVENFTNPGRPIGHQQRGDWANGWIQRDVVYADTPAFTGIKRIVNDVTDNTFGMDLDSMAELHRSRSEVVGVSLVDAQFALNPDIIYHRVHAEDVSKHVFEQHYFTIDPIHYSPSFKGMVERGRSKRKVMI